MYAGATLTFHAPILVGDKLRRETEFSDVQLRKGSTGTLIVADADAADLHATRAWH